MKTYGNDREWSDKFIPAIRRVVGPLLLEPAPIEEDNQRATDLIIFKARDLRIAARMRTSGYSEKYPYDFTIRSARPSGVKTELEKIISGFGDWMFYGHASATQNDLDRWMVIDLAAFREALILKETRERIRMNKKVNEDGTCFLAFDVRSFPQNILVSSSHKIEFAAYPYPNNA